MATATKEFRDEIGRLMAQPNSGTVIDPNDLTTAMSYGPIPPPQGFAPSAPTPGPLGEAYDTTVSDRFKELQAEEEAKAMAKGNRPYGMPRPLGQPSHQTPVASYKVVVDPRGAAYGRRRVALDAAGNEINDSIFAGSPFLNDKPPTWDGRSGTLLDDKGDSTGVVVKDIPTERAKVDPEVEKVDAAAEAAKKAAEGTFAGQGGAAAAVKPAGAGGGAVGGGPGGGASASASQSQAEVAPGGGDFDSPYFTEAGAAGAAAGAHRQLEQIEGDRAAKQAEVDAKAMRDLDRMNAEYEVKSKAHMAHLEEMAKEVESGKIDPERWWHSQSTGQQVLYHIAAFIGGFGAGFSGQPNSAMEIINRKITNDIEAQREDLLNKHKNIENVHSLLAETYKRTHNMEEAMLLAKNVAVDQVAAQAKALGVGAQGTLADAESLHKIAVIDQWRQQENERRDEFLQTETMKLAIARMHAKKAGGTGAASEKEVEALGKTMESRNIDEMDNALSRVEADLSAKDPAGIGPIKNLAQNDTPVGTVVRWGLSQEGRDNQADLANLKVQLTKNLSKVSAGTVKTVGKFMESGTADGMRHAAQIIRSDLEDQRSRVLRSYPETVQYEYLRRQGRLPGQGTPAAPNTGSSVPMAPLTGGK